jgi:hypothetical protein
MRVLAVIEVPKLFGRFILHSVRYAALIQAESPTNCDVHLAESVFQTRSKVGDDVTKMIYRITWQSVEIVFQNKKQLDSL